MRQVQQSRDDEGAYDHHEGDCHRGFRSPRELRPTVVQPDEDARGEDGEEFCQRSFIEAVEDQGWSTEDRLQGEDDAESESVDVERRDDAMAKPRHPASEEAPRVAHRSADPEISAPGLRGRGAELHVRHGGGTWYDEVQAAPEGEPRNWDPETGPDEPGKRRSERP